MPGSKETPREHQGNTKGPADTAPGAGAALTPFTAASLLHPLHQTQLGKEIAGTHPAEAWSSGNICCSTSLSSSFPQRIHVLWWGRQSRAGLRVVKVGKAL